MDSVLNWIAAFAWLAWGVANDFASEPLGQGIGAALLAYFIYRLGLRAYFGQRRADRVRERFVESGIDLFAANLDQLLSTQRNNWQMMLRYLKLIRDAPNHVVPDEFFNSILEVDPKSFNVVAAHRVTELLGEQLFWLGYQKVLSFVGTKADFIVGDFGSAIRAIVKNERFGSTTDFVAAAQEEAAAMSEKAEPFYVFLAEVNSLAALADAKVYDRKAAISFKHQPEVKVILERLKAAFPEWTARPDESKGTPSS